MENRRRGRGGGGLADDGIAHVVKVVIMHTVSSFASQCSSNSHTCNAGVRKDALTRAATTLTQIKWRPVIYLVYCSWPDCLSFGDQLRLVAADKAWVMCGRCIQHSGMIRPWVGE